MSINSLSRILTILMFYCVYSGTICIASELEAKTLPVIRFAITPWQKDKSIRELHEQYRPMISWLGEQTGHTIEIISGRTYQDTIDMISSGKVHLANLSPVPYVLAKEKLPGINILVTEVSWNKDHSAKTDSYLGYIVCKKENIQINTIADLKDKYFGFVKRESSSGYRYPNAMLKKININYQNYFTKTYFLGSHPRVTDALIADSIDAGATWDYNLRQAVKKHGAKFKIIFTTPPIPNLCIVAHPSLSKDLQSKIQMLLTQIDEDMLENVTADGFVVRNDSFYDIVRLVIKSEK
ncbi:MAG: phosphate/phosphite/phosphonate ABC transporter substrate-binding protein [Planctomycetes bacterium]|nr:phosphate/phosphite/phosphonate ABC transporter substrate-binding protein [Planctomycetota bacterium]